MHAELPAEIVEASMKVARFCESRGYQNWQIGGCADRATYERMWQALHTIAQMPVPEQDNMLSANMRSVAAEALRHNASLSGGFAAKNGDSNE